MPSKSPEPEVGNIKTGTANEKPYVADEVDGQLSVFRTMEECDSLLSFLKNRAAGRYMENTIYPETFQNKTMIGGIKNRKDDKTIIEELRMHNDALRTHILELLRENEGYYKELQTLRKENVELHKSRNNGGKRDSFLTESTDSEKSEKYYPNPHRIDINDLPSLELPPLEMPTFDFNSLNKLSDSQ